MQSGTYLYHTSKLIRHQHRWSIHNVIFRFPVVIYMPCKQSVSLLTSLWPAPRGHIAVKYSSCNKGQKQQ